MMKILLSDLSYSRASISVVIASPSNINSRNKFFSNAKHIFYPFSSFLVGYTFEKLFRFHLRTTEPFCWYTLVACVEFATSCIIFLTNFAAYYYYIILSTRNLQFNSVKLSKILWFCINGMLSLFSLLSHANRSGRFISTSNKI